MPAAAVNQRAPNGLVGKKDLCAILGWSRPRLDRRLEEDATFPVVSRGDRGGGWAFEPAVVLDYLAGAPRRPGANSAPPLVSEPQEPIPFPVGGRGVQHQGELTFRQQRDQADAELKLDRLRRGRGELVEAAQMRDVLANMLVETRATLINMPGQLAKEFELPERVGFAMQGKVEALMRGLHQRLQQQLSIAPPAED